MDSRVRANITIPGAENPTSETGIAVPRKVNGRGIEYRVGGHVHEEDVRESWKHVPNFEKTLNDIDDDIRNGPRILNSKAAATEITANQINSSYNMNDIKVMEDDLVWENQVQDLNGRQMVSNADAMIIRAEFNMGWDGTGLKGVKNRNRPNKCGSKGKQQIKSPELELPEAWEPPNS